MNKIRQGAVSTSQLSRRRPLTHWCIKTTEIDFSNFKSVSKMCTGLNYLAQPTV